MKTANISITLPISIKARLDKETNRSKTVQDALKAYFLNQALERSNKKADKLSFQQLMQQTNALARKIRPKPLTVDEILEAIRHGRA